MVPNESFPEPWPSLDAEPEHCGKPGCSLCGPTAEHALTSSGTDVSARPKRRSVPVLYDVKLALRAAFYLLATVDASIWLAHHV